MNDSGQELATSSAQSEGFPPLLAALRGLIAGARQKVMRESLTPTSLVQTGFGTLVSLLPPFVSRYAVELPKKEEMERFIVQLGREVPE